MRKQKQSKQQQRRNDPPRFDIFAAALYWAVRLVLMLWDRFIN